MLGAQRSTPGGTILYTITGQVVASAGSTIINTATVSGNIKNIGVLEHRHRAHDGQSLGRSDDHESGLARSGLRQLVADDAEGGAEAPPASPPLLAPPVCLGGLTYTIVIGNSGINTASGVRGARPAAGRHDLRSRLR